MRHQAGRPDDTVVQLFDFTCSRDLSRSLADIPGPFQERAQGLSQGGIRSSLHSSFRSHTNAPSQETIAVIGRNITTS